MLWRPGAELTPPAIRLPGDVIRGRHMCERGIAGEAAFSHTRTRVVLPEVVRHARQFFGCENPALDGLELENNVRSHNRDTSLLVPCALALSSILVFPPPTCPGATT